MTTTAACSADAGYLAHHNLGRGHRRPEHCDVLANLAGLVEGGWQHVLGLELARELLLYRIDKLALAVNNKVDFFCAVD